MASRIGQRLRDQVNLLLGKGFLLRQERLRRVDATALLMIEVFGRVYLINFRSWGCALIKLGSDVLALP